MPHRPVVRAGVDLVALLDVEVGRLEAERVEEDVATAPLDSALLRRGEQPLPVALPPQGPGDPEDPDIHDAAPDRGQEAALDLVAVIAEEEVDRRVLGEPGHSHV